MYKCKGTLRKGTSRGAGERGCQGAQDACNFKTFALFCTTKILFVFVFLDLNLYIYVFSYVFSFVGEIGCKGIHEACNLKTFVLKMHLYLHVFVFSENLRLTFDLLKKGERGVRWLAT